jgi:thiol:disulfide interchange protein DsbD
MWIRSLFAALACAFALAAAPASAEPFRTDNVEIELHANRAAIAPGETFTIVLRQNIREHWHTYWRNPGDSGEPTEVLSWDLPQGFSAGAIQWPAPEPMRFDIIFSFVYSGEILLPMQFTAPANARIGDTAIISGEFYWLVCADVCIPEQGRVSIALPIEAAGRDDAIWAPRIAAAVEALPARASFDVRITPGEPALLTLALPNAGAIRNPFFFPYDQNTLEHGADQAPRTGPRGLSFSLTEGVDENLGQVPIEGVVAYEMREGAGWTRRAVEIRAEPGRALSGTSDSPANVTPDLVTVWTADNRNIEFLLHLRSCPEHHSFPVGQGRFISCNLNYSRPNTSASNSFCQFLAQSICILFLT